jgi:phosphatidate cytidylyltransferase
MSVAARDQKTTETFRALPQRAASGLLAFGALVVAMWIGWPALLPLSILAAIWSLREYRIMLRAKGLSVGDRSIYVYAALLLIWSLPTLPMPVPGATWREIVVVTYALHMLVREVARPAEKALERMVYGLFGMLYIPLLLSFGLLLRYLPDARHGFWYLLITVLGAYASDTGAYFVGSTLGKRKLAPEISPNKTLEGAIGGTVLSFLMVFGMVELARVWSPPGVNIYDAVIFGILVSSAAQLGDLAESVIKRSLGAKDSGKFLPGHGGLLDRLDSVMFALPVAFYFLAFSVFGPGA